MSAIVTVTGTAYTNRDKAAIDTNRYFLEKQVGVANEISASFSIYIENWRRLIEFRKFLDAQSVTPTDEEQKRLFAIAAARDAARDRLLAALDATNLFFEVRVSDVAFSFRVWDETQATKDIHQLPEVKEWQLRSRQVLLEIRNGLLR